MLPTGAELVAKRDLALARAMAPLGGTLTAERARTLYER